MRATCNHSQAAAEWRLFCCNIRYHGDSDGMPLDAHSLQSCPRAVASWHTLWPEAASLHSASTRVANAGWPVHRRVRDPFGDFQRGSAPGTLPSLVLRTDAHWPQYDNAHYGGLEELSDSFDATAERSLMSEQREEGKQYEWPEASPEASDGPADSAGVYFKKRSGGGKW